MHFFKILFIFLLAVSCKDISNKEKVSNPKPIQKIIKTENKIVKKEFVLDDKNAIPFLFEYGKKNKENKVRISTSYGNIDILLFKNTHYHRSNFIYLTKKKYFNGEFFHRVVKGFIIQGGNSDNISTSIKRRKIGRYLLPTDTKKGYKHHRGTISMPSSEIENPHKLASPYEFFIVQKIDGAYHLDKNYTAFGKVIKGMDVVDKISNLETDKREWPLEDVRFDVQIIE
ncbi:MAG: peptidylprolyl isomerase [Flavobacteriaceae bacterium]|nr:peptidylprolyl isomerase [Flavobacteriaceae bacterium]